MQSEELQMYLEEINEVWTRQSLTESAELESAEVCFCF